MFCTTCGASNVEDAQFCVNCGESLMDEGGRKKPSLLKRLTKASPFAKGSPITALFDLSFTHLYTPRIIRPLYAISIGSAGLMALFMTIFGFRTSAVIGVFTLLIGAPLVFFLSVIYTRILLELIISLFRVADSLSKRAEKPDSREGIEWNV